MSYSTCSLHYHENVTIIQNIMYYGAEELYKCQGPAPNPFMDYLIFYAELKDQ